ncbi:hypothetical protein DFS34DRAFT_681610 [Phlyctochytrium arcticum]|nr:hypothetical protein DFS34DRAFT_681610 [Phlyctochytrium arcticum]
MREAILIPRPYAAEPDASNSGKRYSNLFSQLPAVQTTNYPRPHRKALMPSLFQSQKHAASPAHRISLAGSVQLVSKRHSNPVAAAMDLPFVSRSQIQAVRRPPHVPPAMEEAHKLVEGCRVAMGRLKRNRRQRQSGGEERLQLRVEADLRREMGDLLSSGGLFEEVGQGGRGQDHPPTITGGHSTVPEISQPHKSMWLQASFPPKRIHAGSSDHAFIRPIDVLPSAHSLAAEAIAANGSMTPGGEQDGTRPNTPGGRYAGKPAESFSTRNVPFMLEVWQRAEGVDLKQMMNGGDEGRRSGRGSPTRSRPTTGSKPSTRFASMTIPLASDAGSPSRPGTPAVQLSKAVLLARQPALPSHPATPPRPKSPKTLSRSTVRFLKKLTKDTLDPEATALTDASITSLIRVTLTGTGSQIDQPLATGRAGGQVVPRRKRRGAYTPGGDMRKAIKAAEMRSRTGMPSSAESNADDYDLALVIPEVKEVVDEEVGVEPEEDVAGINSQSIEPGGGTGSAEDTASRPATASGMLHSLSTDATRFLQALGKPTKRHTSIAQMIRQDPHVPRSAPVKIDLYAFNLARLVTMLKRLSKDVHYMHAPEPPSASVSIKPKGSSAEISPPQWSITHVTDFLTTPFVHMIDAPVRDSPGWDAVIKTLTLALEVGIVDTEEGGSGQPAAEKADDIALRFEACRLLITLNAYQKLGRWEGIAFKRVLQHMLQTGHAFERNLAATCFASLGTINADVLARLRSALGDLDNEARQRAITTLKGLSERWVEEVVEGLLEDSGSTSWKVRCDAVELLETYIQKLSAAIGEVDEVSVSDSMRNLWKSAATLDPSPSTSQPASRPTTRATAARRALEQDPAHIAMVAQRKQYQALLASCMEVLLKLMWNDWHPQVRDTAAVVLNRLGKGKSILEWILRLLSSPDPLRRVDALKSLARLGIITSESMDQFLACLNDEFANVRLETCKLACILGSGRREMVNALLDRLNDFDWRVRAYAVKGMSKYMRPCFFWGATFSDTLSFLAIGMTQNTDTQVRETLRCCLYHEPHASVRAEAIQAAYKLGLLGSSKDIQEAVFTLMETDRVPAVKKEAEHALVVAGLIFPTSIMDGDGGGSRGKDSGLDSNSTVSTSSVPPPQQQQPQQQQSPPATSSRAAPPGTSRLTSMNMVPFPHLLSNRRPSEIEVFLRTSLVAEKEQEAVIEKVRSMAEKDAVTAEVAYLDSLEGGD